MKKKTGWYRLYLVTFLLVVTVGTLDHIYRQDMLFKDFLDEQRVETIREFQDKNCIALLNENPSNLTDYLNKNNSNHIYNLQCHSILLDWDDIRSYQISHDKTVQVIDIRVALDASQNRKLLREIRGALAIAILIAGLYLIISVLFWLVFLLCRWVYRGFIDSR